MFLPVDVPNASPGLVRALGEACLDAATTSHGPLPAAISQRALPVLERRLASNELRLRDAIAELDSALVEADPAELVNVNRPEDLETIRHLTGG